MSALRAQARKLALVSLTAAAIASVLAGCSREGGGNSAAAQGGGAPQAIPVQVVEVQPRTIPRLLEAVGQTEGVREVEVRARVGGILEERLYREGAPVKAGQVLFRIDPKPYEIALAQAEAQLAQAKAQVEQARREAKRLEGLVAQEAISRREYDEAVSTAALTEAQVQAAEARVQEAELNLSYTKVTAPVAGVSDRAYQSEGALIATGGEAGLLTRIFQVNPIRAAFSLSYSDVSQLSGGQLTPENVKNVELILPDGSVYPEPGKLDFSASAIDPQLSTLRLRAEFPNAKARVLPGQFVRVRLQVGEQEGVFLVPQQAVMQSAQGAAVFVVGPDGKAQPRPVQTAGWQGKDWIVTKGLQPGDKVIVTNLIKVRPGAPVTAVAPGGAPAPGSAAPGAPGNG